MAGVVIIATGVALAARVAETPSWMNCPLNRRDGFNSLVVLSPSAPLITPSNSVGSIVPAPASSCSSWSAASGIKRSTLSTTKPTGASPRMTITRVCSLASTSG
jgi:hypothetical protein